MSGRGVSLDKERHWERIIREAARSGMSVSEFCRRSKLREKQFYWWRRGPLGNSDSGKGEFAAGHRARHRCQYGLYRATLGFFPPTGSDPQVRFLCTVQDSRHVEIPRTYFKAQVLFGIPGADEYDLIYSTKRGLDMAEAALSEVTSDRFRYIYHPPGHRLSETLDA